MTSHLDEVLALTVMGEHRHAMGNGVYPPSWAVTITYRLINCDNDEDRGSDDGR